MRNDVQLGEDDLAAIKDGRALDKDYFYIPVITYHQSAPSGFEKHWFSLRCADKIFPYSLVAYASKVPAGITLWQAVRSDLEKDFDFPHDQSFFIEHMHKYDTAPNKEDTLLTRLLVDVTVHNRFDISHAKPIGKHVIWNDDGLEEDGSNPVWQGVGREFIYDK